ncbi:hypothetical protein D1007_40473 [Hordeum vulgare]|nr:hypothetical protein D1007_40473 [Hordeum vulgare]
MSGSDDSQDNFNEPHAEYDSGTSPERTPSNPRTPCSHGMPKAATRSRKKLNSDEEDYDFVLEVSTPQKQKDKSVVRKGSSKGKAPADLEAAMRNMKLKEAELDAVMVDEEEISRFSEETRWLAVAKVHTTKPFSAESFKTTMKFVWCLAYDPRIREADDNLFIIQMFVLGIGTW